MTTRCVTQCFLGPPKLDAPIFLHRLSLWPAATRPQAMEHGAEHVPRRSGLFSSARPLFAHSSDVRSPEHLQRLLSTIESLREESGDATQKLTAWLYAQQREMQSWLRSRHPPQASRIHYALRLHRTLLDGHRATDGSAAGSAAGSTTLSSAPLSSPGAHAQASQSESDASSPLCALSSLPTVEVFLFSRSDPFLPYVRAPFFPYLTLEFLFRGFFFSHSTPFLPYVRAHSSHISPLNSFFSGRTPSPSPRPSSGPSRPLAATRTRR